MVPSSNDLTPNGGEAIAWNIIDQNAWRHMASRGHDPP